jgi:hypothetical protein
MNEYILIVFEAARIVAYLGEERRLNEMNREVAGLERGRSVLVGNQIHVLIETAQNVMER